MLSRRPIRHLKRGAGRPLRGFAASRSVTIDPPVCTRKATRTSIQNSAHLSLSGPTRLMGPILQSKSGCAGGSKFITVPVVTAAGNQTSVSPGLLTSTDATTGTQHFQSCHDASALSPVVCEPRQRWRAALAQSCSRPEEKHRTACGRSGRIALASPAVAGHERGDAFAIRVTWRLHGLSQLQGHRLGVPATPAGQGSSRPRERRNHGLPVRLLLAACSAMTQS